ncbi:MAG TPA: c-type cytochrome [Usitatibacter sp.]|nr:c-type cytochrome [Usitatibacter sp.]
MKRAALAFTLCLALPAFAQPVVKAGAGDDLRALQATSQDVAEGRKLAQDTCGKCHGLNGVSPGAGVPNIAGQRAMYLNTQLKAYRDVLARSQTPMGAVVKFLSDPAMVKVSAYYASLDPARPAPPAKGATGIDPLASAKSAVQACAGCHGENGVSAMAGTPNLTAHDPKYFVSAMQAYKAGKRKNDMMKGMASSLSEPDLDGVALYFALMKPAKTANAAKGDAAAGKAASSACAGCHGESGVSATATTPSLAGQDPEYLAAATKAYKDGSRADETMKGIASALDDKTMRDLAAFYASLTPQAVNVRKPLTTAEWVDRCDRCHGANGNSTDPAVPALAAQRADWLETVLGNYRSGARKSTAMSAMTSGLTEGDIKDIAAYYSRQSARSVTYILLPAK